MSRILLDMIHNRALVTKPDVDITAKNYHLWVTHWFITAEKLANEFANQGLINTYDAIQEIIRKERKYHT
jgi:hypothetical protein